MLCGLGVDVATVRPPQRRGDLAAGQPAGPVGVGCLGQQLECVGGVQVGERLEGGGEEVPQRRPQPQQVPGAVPDQALVGAGDQLDRLGILGVAGDRPVVGAVQPDDLGQQVRVGGIGLRARGGVPFPVAGHRHRVDREHLVAGRDQRRDPRAAVGLDADLAPAPGACPGSRSAHSSGRCSAISACSAAMPSMPSGNRLRASTRPSSSTSSTSWWSSAQSSPTNNIALPPAPALQVQQRGGDSRRSNGQVLTTAMRGTTSQQRFRLLTTSGRTVCRRTSMGRSGGVLTRRPLPEPSLPKRPDESH